MRCSYGFLCGVLGLLMVGGAARAEFGDWAGSDALLKHNVIQTIVIPQLKLAHPPGTDLGAFPWTQAARVTGLTPYGKQGWATQPTWVYVFYDASAIWLAYRCQGKGGMALETKYTARDGYAWRDDSVEFYFNPGHSYHDYYQVVVNASSVIYDAYRKQEDWDISSRARITTDDQGWTVVLSVPFSDLGRETPRRDEVWAANFGHHSFDLEKGYWAPNVVTEQGITQFGRMVFGGPALTPVRFARVDAIGMGVNEWRIDPRPGTSYRLVGKDRAGEALFDERRQIDEKGRMSLTLHDDRVRRIEVDVLDEKGAILARVEYPMQSPEVTPRLQMLQERIERITHGLERFGPAARGRVDALLATNRPVLERAVRPARDRDQHTPETWQQLDQTARELDLKLSDARDYAATLVKFPGADFALGLESPMRKVMIQGFGFEGWVDDHYDLALARNEHEGLQVVVIPFHQDLKNVTVSATPLRSKAGASKAGASNFAGRVEVSLVGHEPTYEVDYHGWWPDPLLNFQQSCDVKQGEHVAFWIDVSTGPKTAAGDYEGMIEVRADGGKTLAVRLNVRVWDFRLAKGTHLPNAFTYHQPYTRKMYGERWSEELAYKYYDFILDHRLSIDHLYRSSPPDLEVVKYGVRKGMNAFNISRNTKELDAYVPKLRKARLLRRAYAYGFDEVKDEKFAEVKQVFDNLRRRYPGLRTMTTAADKSFGKDSGLREAVDIWVPLTDIYDLKEARKLRSEGKEMWWYVCVVPRHPYANWFVESPALEARLLTGSMSYKYEAGGFLYYMINLWLHNRNVISKGPYTDWNPGSFTNEKKKYTANGDGSLLCAGPDGPVSTMRLENIRDGFEDYEYLYELARAAKAVRKRPSTPDRQAYLQRAAKLLAVPSSVVTNVVQYSRDPAALYAFRTRVAEAILEGKQLAGPSGR